MHQNGAAVPVVASSMAAIGTTAPALRSAGQTSARRVLPLVANRAPLVANPEVAVVANDDFATTEPEDDFEIEDEIDGRIDRWRIEKNSNGAFRYRWQLKDDVGNPITYETASGGIGYRRGSKYLPKWQAIREMSNGQK